MAKTLTVRNIEQAAAFLELDGQLSDGYWENTRPDNHWQPWCDAEVVVGENVGRNFKAKDNYDFTAKALLDVVGKRMLGIVRIARGVSLGTAMILEHAVDCETGRIDWEASWNASRKAELEGCGYSTEDVDAALADETYTMSHLHRDLNDLKAIIKIRIWENGVAN